MSKYTTRPQWNEGTSALDMRYKTSKDNSSLCEVIPLSVKRNTLEFPSDGDFVKQAILIELESLKSSDMRGYGMEALSVSDKAVGLLGFVAFFAITCGALILTPFM